MRHLLAPTSLWLIACGSPPPPAGSAASSAGSAPQTASANAVAPSAAPAEPWATPSGFRSETIPFPLEFAPGLAHQGVEELRFAPGFFDPAAPGYWSYTFVWRTDDPAVLDAGALAAELTLYFRGLIAAVDATVPGTDTITVRAAPAGARVTLAAHVIDAFKTKQPLDLVGWSERQACGSGALWRFVLAPPASPLHPQLDSLARSAACGQPLPAAPPPRAP
jgi:hypothetical protein